MEKKNNEMGYWLVFILILMCISISIILYFRLPKSLNNVENVTIDKETIIIN